MIEWTPWSGTFFSLVLVLPLLWMRMCWRLAGKYSRPRIIVAIVPVSVWVIPGLSFWLREVLSVKPLPLLGIAVGCVGCVAAFVLSGGMVEQQEVQIAAQIARDRPDQDQEDQEDQ